jgi:hypothetical protein
MWFAFREYQSGRQGITINGLIGRRIPFANIAGTLPKVQLLVFG